MTKALVPEGCSGSAPGHCACTPRVDAAIADPSMVAAPVGGSAAGNVGSSARPRGSRPLVTISANARALSKGSCASSRHAAGSFHAIKLFIISAPLAANAVSLFAALHKSIVKEHCPSVKELLGLSHCWGAQCGGLATPSHRILSGMWRRLRKRHSGRARPINLR